MRGLQTTLRGLAAAALVASCVAATADEPKLDCAPFPLPEFKLTWVAPDMIYNGLPMQVRKFDSNENMQAILAYYRREWKAVPPQRPGAIEYDVGEWKAIAILRDRCFYTVQVQSAGAGATGLLGVTQLQNPAQRSAPGKGFPMLSGSNVVNDISHRDPGKAARTILLMNAYSPATNADFYRRNMGAEGWRVIADHALPMRGGNGESYSLTLKRGLNEASMTIARAGDGSSVLVNVMDRP